MTNPHTEMRVCDVAELCLYDHWVVTSTTPVDPGGTFTICEDVNAHDVILTNSDINDPIDTGLIDDFGNPIIDNNPCVEFDGTFCGVIKICYTVESPTCENCEATTFRFLRNCCLTADINCN